MIEIRKIAGLIFLLIFSSIFLPSQAKALDLVFPFPKGNVYVTNGYGAGETHQGKYFYSLDFRAYKKEDGPCSSYGAPILAAEAGQVTSVHQMNTDSDKSDYGTYLIIKNSNGEKSWYAHMIKNSIIVKGPTKENTKIPGDLVQQGQILGLLGDTGNTHGMTCKALDGINSGAHLHFEMRDQDGKAFKPEPMVGENNYTDISKAGNPYISTTVMIDPEKRWGLYKWMVPYQIPSTGEKTENSDAFFSKFWNQFSQFFSQKKTWTNEKALEYVMSAHGQYNDEFLEWVGWVRGTGFADMNNNIHEGWIKYIKNSDRSIYYMMAYDQNEAFVHAFDANIEEFNRKMNNLNIRFLTYKNTGNAVLDDFIIVKIFEELPITRAAALTDEEMVKRYKKLLKLLPEERRYEPIDSAKPGIRFGVDLYHQEAPDKTLIDAASQSRLRYIDISYEFTNSQETNSLSPAQHMRYLLDFADCQISNEEMRKLKRLANGESSSDFMKKVWNSNIPPPLKFYVQQWIDFYISDAKYFQKVLAENHYDCKNLKEMLSELLKEEYQKIPLDELQKNN